MASITNKSLSTATIVNRAFSSADLTWAEATFTWAEGSGTWGNPYNLANKAVNTATITNKSRDT